jgi:hypothetical protein
MGSRSREIRLASDPALKLVSENSHTCVTIARAPRGPVPNLAYLYQRASQALTDLSGIS